MMGSGSKRSAMIQMIEGLKYIHNSGFLHRDIKPENVFISEQTPTNIVLGDLGLLSPVGAIGRMAGTKIYKAPEVYYEDRQTAAIDIFALGVTFIQMLDDRACKGGWRGLKKWVEGLWDHPPPPPCSRLIIQMTAPYPPELRPSLNTIQNLIMQQKDLPESVQGPAMTLGETMKMLEQKHAPPAVIDPPVPMVVPITRLAPLQPRARYSKSRLVPNNYGLHAEIAATKKVVPLDVVHKARGPASPTPAMAAPRHPESSWLKQDPPAYKLKPAQGQPAQSVDFTRPREDPGNIFARQKIKLLEAQLEAEKRLREIDKDQMRLAEDLRNHRRERQRYRKTNQVCHAPYPGEWPSRPTFPGSGSFSKESQFFSDATSKVTSDGHTFLSSLTSSALYTGRSSHRSRGGVSSHIGNDRLGRSARTRINTHARHNERTSKRETVSFQSKLLEGLALALQTGASGIGTTLSKSIRWMLGYRLRD